MDNGGAGNWEVLPLDTSFSPAVVPLTSGRALKPWLGFLNEDVNIYIHSGVIRCLQRALWCPDDVSLCVWFSLSLAFQAHSCKWRPVPEMSQMYSTVLDATAEAELRTWRLSGLDPNIPWFQGKWGTTVLPQACLVHASDFCPQRSFPPQALLNVFLG